ncbi:hypothetical protein KQ940_18610 [Marinobacterium sp. D7]|uniref:hypothetical protein n=1 Tax=Marinobacterium ramblicola TaxID=2849041 RepID=UPI001C2DD0C7|nr:hypothetical protein [Marinobacterium ramblicola]MBV1790072.1 hypothetical protein [Marinobacterium ramblicola]
MSKSKLSLACALATAFIMSPAYAASAKFAAYVADTQLLSTNADSNTNKIDAPEAATILNATIRTPNKKDLLIGVSLEAGLYTETNVKGKNGSSEVAGAEGGIQVSVLVDGVPAMPGQVTFAKRFQELSATLGGVIESCQVTSTDEDGDGVYEGTVVIERDCLVSDEEIGLVLSTTAAHHFNFVMHDLAPGDHRVEVVAQALSSADVTNGTYTAYDPDTGAPYEVTTTNNEASAYAVVGKGSLTVQEVQAVNVSNPLDGNVLELF